MTPTLIAQETIRMVQKVFHELADIEPDRLSLYIHIDDGCQGGCRWAALLDETWATLKQNPPKRLRVVVADLPGDAEKR
jgi:hypothetical protein